MMTIFERMHPRQPLKNLKWFDILIVTGILFGWFIYTSTQTWLSQSNARGQVLRASASEDVWLYANNLKLQILFLVLALLYLLLRHYDFKQLQLRLSWSLLWAPLIFAMVGLASDLVATLAGSYNYFDPRILQQIDWTFVEVARKIFLLPPLTMVYALFNGFYEEFFFLGLLTSVNQKYKWPVLAYSTLVRFAFHTYQGLLSAFIIGVVFGLIYYFLYTYKIKNLWPFFLAHAIADFFGSSLIYLLVVWR